MSSTTAFFARFNYASRRPGPRGPERANSRRRGGEGGGVVVGDEISKERGEIGRARTTPLRTFRYEVGSGGETRARGNEELRFAPPA